MVTFLTRPIAEWNIEESDIIMSIFTSGDFKSLMIGSYALFQDSQLCVVLGFSNKLNADQDLSALTNENLDQFNSSLYCKDSSNEKALVLFLGDGKSFFVPELRALDIHSLQPISNILESQDKDLLYNKTVIKNLTDILSIDVDDKSPLVLRQS